MKCFAPIRLAAALLFSIPVLLSAQSPQASISTPAANLPATQPTALPLTPAQRPAHRADVTYTNGQLSVSANNASLNQILREIGRLTGMKITGGVADERVFGQYGPAPASRILASLLDGTSSNMLIVQSPGASPSELILTPRMGGPSPPNPNARAFDNAENDSEDSPQQRFSGAPQSVQQPPPAPGATFPESAHPESGRTTNDQPAPAPATPDSTSSDPTQQSPNGVKTPQQIYDQLQRLRQQQQQQQQQQPRTNPQ